MAMDPVAAQKERERLEKEQEEHLNKACKNAENAPKQKHIRAAIITTWQHNGGSIFWSAIRKLPLGAQPIMCWKAMICLHKVLQDGHPNVVKEFYAHKTMLQGLSQLWQQNHNPLTQLISAQIIFINSKLDFHHKHPEIMGNLNMEDYLRLNVTSNVDAAFALAVDLFELQEAVLFFQGKVLSSLSAALSTDKSEMRIAALVPLIHESEPLYNMLRDIMLKLHRQLSPSQLAGHRDRFTAQFADLKQFYFDAANIKYLNTLCRVPVLEDSPPNFLEQPNVPKPVEQPKPVPPPQVDAFASFGNFGDTFSFQSGPDERDRLIEQLRARIRELEAQHEADVALIASLRQRLEDATRATSDLQVRLNDATDQKSQFEDKYQKAFGLYSKLRQEHLNLLKKATHFEKLSGELEHYKSSKDVEVAGLHAELDRYKEGLSKMQSDVAGENIRLNAELAKKTKEFEELQKSLLSQRASLDGKVATQESTIVALHEDVERLKQQHFTERRIIIDKAVHDARMIVENALRDLDDPAFAGNQHSTAEGVIDAAHSSVETNAHLAKLFASFVADPTASLPYEVIGDTIMFARMVSDLMSSAKGNTRLAGDEGTSEEIILNTRTAGEAALEFIGSLQCGDCGVEALKSKGPASIALAERYKDRLSGLIGVTDRLIIRDVEDTDKLGKVVEEEMMAAAQAIASAARRIQDLIDKANREQEGLKLDINTSILAAAQSLMNCIRVLIERATTVQSEIVDLGKGGASAQEFYKKNSRWTEGLISAAKAVGFGATMLVDAADKVVQGTGKFEELIVASREVAASTAQLVAASRVKSGAKGKSQDQLEAASKTVTSAVKQLVAAASSASHVVAKEKEKANDFNKLSMHQAKRAEMELQVKVLELETSLARERERLGEMRRHNYKDAGDVGNE
eukprot:Opistho-2@61821